jgi:hypothetical protein
MDHQCRLTTSESWALLQVQDIANSTVLGRQLPAYRALGGVLLYLAYAVCESEHGIDEPDNEGNCVNRSLVGQYCTSLHGSCSEGL